MTDRLLGLYLLGFLCVTGAALAQESPAPPAVTLLIEQSERGDTDARFALGEVYRHGRHGMDVDPVRASQWYVSAARAGHRQSQQQLGLMYLYGEGLAQSYEQAQHWLFLAANKGDAVAQYHLSLLFMTGRGVAQDVPTARRWLTSAAEQGHAPAQTELGRQLIRGNVFKPDPTNGLSWLQKAIRQNHPDALHLMGELHSQGEHVSANEARAKQFFERAANFKHTPSQVWMAQWHERQTPPKYMAALKLYRLAAEQGDPEAMLGIARLELEAKAPSPNTRVALEHLETAVAMNHPGAIFYMAELVAGGALPGNIHRINALLERAALLGHSEARFELGINHFKGADGSPDVDKAAYWWKLASSQGHAGAQYYYGLLYLRGASVRKDERVGFALINLAAALGHPEAGALRDSLRASLSPARLKSATDYSIDLLHRYVDANPSDALVERLR